MTLSGGYDGVGDPAILVDRKTGQDLGGSDMESRKPVMEWFGAGNKAPEQTGQVDDVL